VCDPCADSTRSRPVYHVRLAASMVNLLSSAIGGDSAEIRSAFIQHCDHDSNATLPIYVCTTYGADTLRAWRDALVRYAASGRAADDSIGNLGIATLAALDRAHDAPDVPPTVAGGTLVRTARGVELRTWDRTVAISGPGADSLATKTGTPVWMQGLCRGRDRMEWFGGHALGGPRVDLFVMGFCPFARRLEAQMSRDLAKLAPDRVPVIAVHYLLYLDGDAPVPTAGSLHGPRERTEDVVQILLRDEHPAQFWPYLALRSTSDEAWELLAQRAGLGWQAISAIGHKVASDGDALLLAELERVKRDFPHAPGSPTVYWRGEEVHDIGKVPGFTAPPHVEEKCPH